MEVCNQAPHIAGGIGASRSLVFGLEEIHTGLCLLIPVLVIPLINTIYLPFLRDADILMGEEKFSNARVKGEAMDPIPCGVDHNCA